MMDAPIILAETRDDYLNGLKFYCRFCRRDHLHGSFEGHRIAHCDSKKSPYYNTGYILVRKSN